MGGDKRAHGAQAREEGDKSARAGAQARADGNTTGHARAHRAVRGQARDGGGHADAAHARAHRALIPALILALVLRRQGELRILVLASGTSTTTLQPYFLKRDKDRCDKLPKFTIDVPTGDDASAGAAAAAALAAGAARPNKLTSGDVRIISL